MITVQELPANLSPAEVIEVTDTLMSNADRLRTSALAMLDRGVVPMARLLAILSLDASGKAIAVHERRSSMG